MAYVLNYLKEFYSYTMGMRDTRVDGWLFMDSPWPTLALCMAYVYTVTNLGPRLMKDRKPFKLREVLIGYNFAMVLLSLWIWYELWVCGWGSGYSFKCQPVDYSDSPSAMRMAGACWWYYFSKFIEFADTIFFVLRKKFNHVSVLHVIHHGCMPMSVWFGVRFTPGGQSTFFGMLNSLVHVIMYTYYGIAALGPQYQKYLWWKKYLTTIQMVQFVMIILHAFQLLFIDCDFPKAFVWWIGGHAIMFFFLFTDFYRSAYMRNRRMIQAKQNTTNGTAPTRNGSSNGISCSLTNGKAAHLNGNGYSNGAVTNQYENGYAKKVE